MKIDRDRFLDEGYLILPRVIPPGDLDGLRASCEHLLEQQKSAWTQRREPGDPPGGEWEKSSQPRVMVEEIAARIDQHSSAAIEIWQHENIHGVSSQLLAVEDAAVTQMMMMCNPVRDYGTCAHNGWHRDVYPPFSAPIQAYTEDIVENAPRYVQWNIPLYDDEVLWIMPGSHRRLNTRAENEQLRRDSRVPFPGGVQTHLKAGDGVVYILPILHWGSNYDALLRRTLHGGFSTFTQMHDICYAEHLSPEARATFARWNARSSYLTDLTEAALRAAIQCHPARYYDTLEAMHPGRGDKGRALTSIYLSKTARSVRDLLHPDPRSVSQSQRDRAAALHPMTLDWGAGFADRFSPPEGMAMWERFQPIDAGLQAATELAPPAYEKRPSHHYFYEMPEDLDIAGIIAQWGH